MGKRPFPKWVQPNKSRVEETGTKEVAVGRGGPVQVAQAIFPHQLLLLSKVCEAGETAQDSYSLNIICLLVMNPNEPVFSS